MNIALLFVALFAACGLCWMLMRRFSDKPWLVTGEIDDIHTMPAQLPARTGLWVFLGVITSLFCLLASAYAKRMSMGDWISPQTPATLWLSTGLLLLASIAYQQARVTARKGTLGRLKIALGAAGLLSLAFVGAQLTAWQQLTAQGYYASSNPGQGFFFLITGLHGLHLLGGLVVWAQTTGRLLRGDDVARLRITVELTSVYWHFLLFVWLGMYGLLLST